MYEVLHLTSERTGRHPMSYRLAALHDALLLTVQKEPGLSTGNVSPLSIAHLGQKGVRSCIDNIARQQRIQSLKGDSLAFTVRFPFPPNSVNLSFASRFVEIPDQSGVDTGALDARASNGGLSIDRHQAAPSIPPNHAPAFIH